MVFEVYQDENGMIEYRLPGIHEEPRLISLCGISPESAQTTEGQAMIMAKCIENLGMFLGKINYAGSTSFEDILFNRKAKKAIYAIATRILMSFAEDEKKSES